jgi:hypothetical protein
MGKIGYTGRAIQPKSMGAMILRRFSWANDETNSTGTHHSLMEP